MNIKKITAIVHPLFHEKQSFVENNNKIQEKIAKHQFGTMGQLVNNSQNSELVVFVKTNFIKGTSLYKQQERFVRWAQKKIGNRFISTAYDFGSPLKTRSNSFYLTQAQLFKFSFASRVKINLTGELKDSGQCINQTFKNLEEILKRKGIKKIQKNVLPSAKSFRQASAISIGLMKKRLREFSQWRRKQTPKKKSKKLLNK